MFGKLYAAWQKIARLHCSDDETERESLIRFFFPRLRPAFFLRMTVVGVLATLLFTFLLMPCRINGASMMPTFPEHGFTFCWKLRYLFHEPKRGNVVIIRYRDKTYFLKRVIALPGDTVEFRNGDLYLNGRKQNESYVRYASDWNLPPRKVEPGHYYVVGDNRSQKINEHIFGSVRADRIIGAPVW